MTFRTYVNDRFSPYLDDDPWVDFFDDIAQRGTTIVASVFAVHIALFFAMQINFVMPDLKEEEEPDPIPVQIVAFEDLKAASEPEAEVIDIAPAVPAPAPRVKPRPKPAPQPAPQPAPPPVETAPPDPIPEPVLTPPPPDILVNETPAETENTIAEYTPPPVTETVAEPQPITEPLPEPQIEIFDPVPIPDPVIDTPPEYEIEIFEPAPPIEPDPVVPDPIVPDSIVPAPIPDPIIEPIPDPLPDVVDPALIEPLLPDAPPPEITALESAPLITPDPIQTPPAPGPVIAQEIIIQEIDLNPLIEPTEPEITQTAPVVPSEPEPQKEIEIEEAPIITTAPTILASPDAPLTSEETQKAVPQEQAAPVNDFLFKPKTGFPDRPAPRRPGINVPAAPSSRSGGGGGAISLDGGSAPPGGGTRRSAAQPNRGSGGWTYAPAGGSAGIGEGGKGLILDIRCREAKRTHADCPAYLAKFKGRNSAGYESFGPHSNGLGGTARSARSGTHENPAVGGGRDPWSLGPGSNSVNAGGPSSSVLDDADFGREFLGTNLGDGTQPSRLRDLLKQPESPRDDRVIKLPEAPEEDGGN